MLFILSFLLQFQRINNIVFFGVFYKVYAHRIFHVESLIHIFARDLVSQAQRLLLEGRHFTFSLVKGSALQFNHEF